MPILWHLPRGLGRTQVALSIIARLYGSIQQQCFLSFLGWYVCKLTPEIIDRPQYNDVIIIAMASQNTGVRIVYSTVCSGPDQRTHQTSASLAFVRGIHRWPVNSPHKGPAAQKMFPSDDVIVWWPYWWYGTGSGNGLTLNRPQSHCICY